jgi:spermidine/putrescine transport system permease protein
VAREVGRRRDRVLRVGTILVYAFLYAPILVLMVLSFNAPGSTSTWGGLSTQWYRELLDSQDLLDALKNTVVVAAVVTAISVARATLRALGLERTVRSRVLD